MHLGRDFGLTGIHVHGAGVDLLLDGIVTESLQLVAVLQTWQGPISNQEEEEEEQDKKQQSQ
jgi:hypothetical protein